MFGKIAERNWQFALSFIGIFILSFVFLASQDLVPVSQTEGGVAGDDINVPSVQETGGAAVIVGETPMRIVASSIDLDTDIQNPSSRDPNVLDNALLKGAVRYPGSALLGEEGNVLLFGHSSYLGFVSDSDFRAFNDIQKLRADDVIRVYSSGNEYRYRVTNVRLARATNADEVIDLSPRGKRLTLVTCNSFATKADRFIVEAEFIGTVPRSS